MVLILVCSLVHWLVRFLVDGRRLVLCGCHGVLNDRLGRCYVVLVVIVASGGDFGRGVSWPGLDEATEFRDTDEVDCV